jgi:hypothetical protein
MCYAPRVAHYEFRKVVEFTEVAPNLVRRWIDAGIIRPAVPAEGIGTRRFFGLRELVLTTICDRLHRLGLGETELRAVSSAVDASWSAWGLPALSKTGSTLLRIGISPHAVRRFDARLSAISGTVASRAVPIVGLVTPLELSHELQHGTFGIVVPLGPIIADLERVTGETLA